MEKVIAFQVERGAQLSKKNLANKTPLDLMFECIQSPGEFISSLWSKRVSLIDSIAVSLLSFVNEWERQCYLESVVNDSLK